MINSRAMMVFELSFLPFWGFALVLVAALALVLFAALALVLVAALVLFAR